MPALNEHELTNAEKIAKRKFLQILRKGSFVQCDIDNIDVLPLWYDETKYKRGQKYFYENRVGILNSNMAGLICLLSEPRGLKILSSTGRSSTKETARKRYISTILHTLRWYEIDMSPGSESRKSLATVRKLHFAASKSAEEKKIGIITQTELSLTAFGFMGLVLIRPEIFGIHCDNQEDREAFVHQWAVLCNMIGIKDEFNICLQPFDSLCILCEMIARYILLPIIQTETSQFKLMTKALIDGLSDLLPQMEHESQLFITKLVLGVPGYQYKIDHSNITLCRSILNDTDINELNQLLNKDNFINIFQFSVDVPIIEIYKMDQNVSDHVEEGNDMNMNSKISSSSLTETYNLEQCIKKNLELEDSDFVKVTFINYEEDWKKSLNDNKFYKISKRAQNIIWCKHYMRKLLDYRITRYLMDSFISLVLWRMRKESNRYKMVTNIDLKPNISSI